MSISELPRRTMDILKDSVKDLKNNSYGHNLGRLNPDGSCFDLLDDRRIPTMKQKHIDY